MAEITSEMVKELREKSGAGMMDCKKALAENGGDVEVALDWLRKKGIAAAAKKSGRVAAEGLVGVAVSGTRGAAIELNSETDFVARNEKFQALASEIAQLALTQGKNVEDLKNARHSSGKTVAEEVTNHIAIIGENISLRRSTVLEVGQGVVASYVHNSSAPGLGKIGVLVALESTGPADKLTALGKQIAMHIAAAKPEALDVASVDPASLEREKDVLREQSKASGKPAEIIEKMLEGRVRKYYEEVVLLEQVFVMDGKTKISDVVAQAGKEMGAPVKLAAFVRYGLGEGIEKETTDFAAEVASMNKVANA